MSDISIFEISDINADLFNYVKIREKAVLNDSIILRCFVYSNNAPVDLSKFNIEYRAILPHSGQVYSEVDNIVKNGNELIITCDQILTSEVGEVISSLRLWNSTTKQKSSYQIVIKVLSTISSDETIATTSVLSAMQSLDLSINRYIELKADLFGGIAEGTALLNNLNVIVPIANTSKSNLDASITNSNNALTNLSNKITEATNTGIQIIKNINDTGIEIVKDINDTATSVNNNLNITISNADAIKSNLQDKIIEGSSLIPNLTTVNNIAQTTKSDLQTEISIADTKLQEFKNFDTDQIVLKANEMYNEMFVINELLTIEHDLEANPLVQFIIIEDGYGMGTFGTSYYGGISECNLGTYKVQYLNKNKLKIIVSNNYYKANPIMTKINNYEYNISFAGYSKTMLIKLLVVDNNSYLIDENGNYIVDELGRYLMG